MIPDETLPLIYFGNNLLKGQVKIPSKYKDLYMLLFVFLFILVFKSAGTTTHISDCYILELHPVRVLFIWSK